MRIPMTIGIAHSLKTIVQNIINMTYAQKVFYIHPYPRSESCFLCGNYKQY